MRPKNFKGGRCIKTKLKKCEEVARTYDKIQTAYADVLDKDKNIEVIKCNVLLENLEDGEFTTDFLCTKTNGDLMVRECVFRKKLSLPRTCKLLDASRKYWARRGITDWASRTISPADFSARMWWYKAIPECSKRCGNSSMPYWKSCAALRPEPVWMMSLWIPFR